MLWFISYLRQYPINCSASDRVGLLKPHLMMGIAKYLPHFQTFLGLSFERSQPMESNSATFRSI